MHENQVICLVIQGQAFEKRKMRRWDRSAGLCGQCVLADPTCIPFEVRQALKPVGGRVLKMHRAVQPVRRQRG